MRYLRSLFVLVAILVCFIVAKPSYAATNVVDNGYQEKIAGYSVNMILNDNGTLNVAERIDYDFGTNQKHGIYRYIPTVYKGRVGNPRQNISGLTVTDGSGTIIQSSLQPSTNLLDIVIGDPNTLITGLHTYEINYVVSNVISSEKDQDRFNWDAIGTGWTVPINNINIKLSMSNKVAQNITGLKCYTGGGGSTKVCDVSRNAATINLIQNYLGSGEGITVDLGLRSGTFPAPSQLEVLFWSSPWYWILPIVALLVYLTIWMRKARFARGRGTIIPIYDAPKDLPPTEASIVLEDHVNNKSLAAEIIFMAIKGYLKIKKIDKTGLKLPFAKADYTLTRLKDNDDSLTACESTLLSALFTKPVALDIANIDLKKMFTTGQPTTEEVQEIKISEISQSFTTQNMEAHNFAYKAVTADGFYVTNPMLTKAIYAAVGVVLIVAGIGLSIYMAASVPQIACFVTPGLLGLLFAFIIPEKTRDGMIAKENLLGLKMYIKAAEIDRIKFHNAPEKSPEKFEELLPYAIIFGLEDEWGKQFEGIYKAQPGWYDGNMQTFTILALTHDLGGFSTITSQAIAQASMSSAGGFAGGGGGGGGGGSW